MGLNMNDSLVTYKDIQKTLKLSKNTIFRMVKKQAFPAPIRLNHKIVRWKMSDIQTWIKSQEQIIDGEGLRLCRGD